MYNPAAHEQVANHNRSFMPGAREFAIAAASGVLAFGAAAGPANAATERSAADSLAAVEAILPPVAAEVQPTQSGEKSYVATPVEVLKGIKVAIRDEPISRVSVAQRGSKVNVNLTQDELMIPTEVGSVYTEKYYPGVDGVQGGMGKTYSKIFRALVSPDLINRNTVTVRAVSKKTGKKQGWKVLSKSVKVPDVENYSVVPIEGSDPGYDPASQLYRPPNKPVGEYRPLPPSAEVALGAYYAKPRASKVSVKVPTSANKKDGIYLEVRQKWSSKKNVDGKQSQGSRVSYFGPFKKKKQSATRTISTTSKERLF